MSAVIDACGEPVALLKEELLAAKHCGHDNEAGAVVRAMTFWEHLLEVAMEDEDA